MRNAKKERSVIFVVVFDVSNNVRYKDEPRNREKNGKRRFGNRKKRIRRK